jgi:small GTP-binding protein
MEDDAEIDYTTCKVVLLGEAGVGKTSIISRYVNNTFSDVLMSTTGASFAIKKLEIDPEHKIKFQIWDTAGQERFRSLAKIFYQNAAVAVLVYDITRRDSFQKLKDFWVKELKENAPSDIILAVAANKSDNYEFEVVSLKEGKELAQEINAIFKSTSAMLSHGIEDLFKLIGEKFINPSLYINEPTITKKEEEFRKNNEILEKNIEILDTMKSLYLVEINKS